MAALAAEATKTSDGDYFPHEHELDSLLENKAMEVQKEMKELAKAEDPTKPKASLAVAKAQVHESASMRAARYFATHGMKKVGHMLGNELSASEQARVMKEQSALKVDAKVDDLSLPEDDEDDNAAYKAQWKR